MDYRSLLLITGFYGKTWETPLQVGFCLASGDSSVDQDDDPLAYSSGVIF